VRSYKKIEIHLLPINNIENLIKFSRYPNPNKDNYYIGEKDAAA